MQKITKKGQPAIFVENPKDLKEFLPKTGLLGFKIDENLVRTMTYVDGEYQIENSDKTKGVYIGDICAICGMGEVVDAGGCATCSRCNAQLKCGL